MSHNYSTTITPDRERGQHLKFEDRVIIKIYKKQGHILRFIAEVIGCSPSTIMYELRRGTGQRSGSRGRLPEYSAKRGQANCEMNRSCCHRKAKALNGVPFVNWIASMIKGKKWSIDAWVGYAKTNELFPADSMVCTKTIYNAVWISNIHINPFDLPEALQRKPKRNRTRKNKRTCGRSIEERSLWERPQNERHNRIFRRFIPKGVSIEGYSAEQILYFSDEMNALPRKRLGY